MRRGDGPAGSGQPAAMAGGERWLGHEGVARDTLEVGGGGGQRGRVPVVARGAGVVGDGLLIGAELVAATVGPSVAGGGSARGGARGGSGRGDLAAEAPTEGRWHRLRVLEATWHCRIA
jgi:hypothetical protein